MPKITQSNLDLNGFSFIPGHDYDPQEYAIVEINISKFDADWIYDDFYLSKKEMLSNPYYLDFFSNPQNKNRNIIMPLAGIDSKGQVGIIDGRHRYGAVRDLGGLSIPMMVPISIADKFRKRYSI